jgi:hypothetical protein
MVDVKSVPAAAVMTGQPEPAMRSTLVGLGLAALPQPAHAHVPFTAEGAQVGTGMVGGGLVDGVALGVGEALPVALGAGDVVGDGGAGDPDAAGEPLGVGDADGVTLTVTVVVGVGVRVGVGDVDGDGSAHVTDDTAMPRYSVLAGATATSDHAVDAVSYLYTLLAHELPP